MKRLLWVAAAVLLFASAMLIAGVGNAGLWIAVIAGGIAVVAMTVSRSHRA